MQTYVNNNTGNKYALINIVTDISTTRSDNPAMALFVAIDSYDNTWCVMDSAEFFSKFTEVINDGQSICN